MRSFPMILSVCSVPLIPAAAMAIELSFQPQNAPADPAAVAAPAAVVPAGGVSPRASYLLSRERIHSDPEVLWQGFLSGLRGFEHFADPVGNPLYFESPIPSTSAKLLYVHHNFPEGSQLRGGDLDVFAVQLRLAVTERLAIIATKDGYSWLDAEALPNDEGWNDLAAGFKYAFWVDRENDFVATIGTRFQFDNGHEEVLQSAENEASPFLSIGKGFGPLSVLADVTGRIPFDDDKGNHVIQWDVSLSYDLLPDVLPGFRPMFEVHGLHYVSDGERLPLSVGGLDYTNLGSSDVDGSTVVWLGVGARWALTPNASVGCTYEFGVTNRDADIMEDRVTLDVILTW